MNVKSLTHPSNFDPACAKASRGSSAKLALSTGLAGVEAFAAGEGVGYLLGRKHEWIEEKDWRSGIAPLGAIALKALGLALDVRARSRGRTSYASVHFHAVGDATLGAVGALDGVARGFRAAGAPLEVKKISDGKNHPVSRLWGVTSVGHMPEGQWLDDANLGHFARR